MLLVKPVGWISIQAGIVGCSVIKSIGIYLFYKFQLLLFRLGFSRIIYQQILLVEDEYTVRRIVGQQLEHLGYELLTASTPHEALTLARGAARLDLLLSDIVLTDKSGPWVRDAVLALHPQTKVLFISGYTDNAVLRHGVSEGSVNFLQKPFTAEALGAKIREILDGEG